MSVTQPAGSKLNLQTPQPATSPKRPLPQAACDCHIHISDGTGRFPIHRRIHPPLHAPFVIHEAMRQATGLTRSIATQLMAYGCDNRALIEALEQSKGSMRGVAELTAAASDADMERLHAAGVRGLRFYFELPRPVPDLRKVEGVGMDDLVALAPRMQALGWVAQISARCDTLVAKAAQFEALRIPIVFEHMAGCEASRGIDDPVVRQLMGLLSTGTFWVKLTICAMSSRYPDCDDIRPLHDAFVAAAPDRLVWGSNWPHGLAGDKTPEMGHLLDLLDDWLDQDDELRRKILSDNPERLFGF